METRKDLETPGSTPDVGGTRSTASPPSYGQDRTRRLERLGERADRLADEAAGKAQELRDRAAETLDNTKDAMSDTYDRTRQALNRTYDRALDYGRENPGTAILIGFGAGVGVGLMLAGGAVRRGRSRVLPVVVNALTDIAYEVLDRR